MTSTREEEMMPGIRGEKNVHYGTTKLLEDSLNTQQGCMGAEAVTGNNGVVDPDVLLTKYTTSAAEAATLADGSYEGQEKVVTLISTGGNLTLTPANFVNGSTITFTAANDMAFLVWTSGGWLVVSTTATTVTIA